MGWRSGQAWIDRELRRQARGQGKTVESHIRMITTHIPDFAAQIDPLQQAQILEEGFLSFGCCLDPQQLAAARVAYEQTYERQLIGLEKLESRIEYPCGLEAFCEEPALVSIIGNPSILAVARAALESDAIEYTGGILRRTSFLQRDVHSIAGWHPDQFQAEGANHARDERVAIWVYLDDVTAAEGATQMVPGSCAIVRRNFLAGREWPAGLEDLLAQAERGENSTYAEAPAGGGMAFKSYVVHRATPNASGIPRRVMTIDFRVLGGGNVPDGNFQSLSPGQRAAMAQWLPPELPA